PVPGAGGAGVWRGTAGESIAGEVDAGGGIGAEAGGFDSAGGRPGAEAGARVEPGGREGGRAFGGAGELGGKGVGVFPDTVQLHGGAGDRNRGRCDGNAHVPHRAGGREQCHQARQGAEGGHQPGRGGREDQAGGEGQWGGNGGGGGRADR